MSRHYLDHASTSPARPEVVEAMLPWLSAAADPGRVHAEGRAARVAIEEAREKVAAFVGARPREVVFTSGGTEAVNAATWGGSAARPGAAVVCAGVEHSAVRDASARHVVAPVAVDRFGRIEVEALIEILDQPGDAGPPALVQCQWANHEVGTLQPVAEVVAHCRERGVLTHVDAAAAVGHVPVDFAAVGADLLSLSAHKFGGPAGIGALLIRRGLRVAPLLVGGDQERARRAGLENVAAIVGFGAACAAVDAVGATEAATASAQTQRVLSTALGLGGVVAYGDTDHR
ncbi:MAG: cysteine desulfurase family protein, partial [Acidimicrobiales bacterium]